MPPKPRPRRHPHSRAMAEITAANRSTIAATSTFTSTRTVTRFLRAIVTTSDLPPSALGG